MADVADSTSAVMFDASAADEIQDVVRDYRRNPPTPPVTPIPPIGGNRPLCVGILLADLPAGGKVDMAILNQVADTTIQEISILGGLVTGGTFQLGFKGPTTPPLQWNVSAADMQTALTNLSTIGANNVKVTLGNQTYFNRDSLPTAPGVQEFPGLWLVTFTGVFAGRTDTPLLNIVSSLAGGVTMMTAATTQWADTGSVESVNAVVPVPTPTPMRAGATVAAGWFPGIGYGVLACEPRQYGAPY